MATDRYDEDYLQERHEANRVEVDRWWSQRVTRQMPEMMGSNAPNVMADRLKEMGQSAVSAGMDFMKQAAPVASEAATAIGESAQIAAGRFKQMFKTVLEEPVADKVIRYFGGTPTNIPEEVAGILREGGVREEMIPNLVPIIEGAMSSVHAMGPGKPPSVQGKSIQEPPRRPPEAPAAEELLGGQAAQDVPPRVNMGRIEADERTKAVLETINRMNVESGATEEAVRGVISHGETVRAAQGSMTVEQLLAMEPAHLNEQVTAARRLRVTSAKHLKDLSERAVAGDAQAADQLYEAIAVHGKIDEKVTAISAEVGRGLEAHKIAATEEAGVFDPAGLGDLADRLRGANPEIDPKRLAEMIKVVIDDHGLPGLDPMIRPMIKHRWGNAILEGWVNGLLSGPQTHAANALSNAMTTLWAIPERQMASLYHPFTDTGVMKGEATQMLYGALSGFQDALTLAGKAFRTGKPASGLSKVEHPPAITAERLHFSGPIGRAVDLLGTVVRTPGRFLMAGDEFFHAINYRMELHAQAYRQAATEGLDGRAMARRIQQIVNDPPASIKDASENFAAYQTFTNALGETGQKGMDFVNSLPALRFIVPFIRTPTNIFKYAMERTPLLNLMSETTRSAMRQGGPARDLAMAKMDLGGMVLATFGTLAAQGVITGDGPHDPELRKRKQETGWQPYSIKVGDTYYSYNRLDPVGMMIGMVANISELSGELPSAELDQLAMAAVLSSMEALTSKTYMQGVANVLEAYRRPDQAGLNYLRSFARSIVPAGVAQLERVIDPQIREVHGLIDEMKARVPGFSADLPPRRNLFGDPIQLEGGLGPDLISPIALTKDKDDPVANEIARLRLPLSMPSKTIEGREESSSPFSEERAGRGVQLTPKEYDLYVRLAGNELKGPGGLGMHDALAKLIQDPKYHKQSDGPDGGKALLIRQMVRKYRDNAELEVRRRSPELNDLIKERMKERKQALMPAREPAGLGIAR